MNKATIESIEWHKDQLFKLLEDDDLIKIEGDIHSVKTELNEIIEKAKKRVWVKPTATKKGHYREQEVGRKEGNKEVRDKKGKTKDELISDELTRTFARIKGQVEEEIIWPEEVIDDVKAYERRKKEKRGAPTTPFAPM